jgi:exonuclease VII large subunit
VNWPNHPRTADLPGSEFSPETARYVALEVMRTRLAQRRASPEQLSAQLSQLRPRSVLERDYAIVSNHAGVAAAVAAVVPS